MPRASERGRFGPWAVASLLVLLANLVACGSVGDPLPPLLHIPSPVNDLSAVQVADKVQVLWTWPLLTTEGTMARQIGGFELWAVDVPSFANPLTPETIDEYRRHVASLGPTGLEGKEPGSRVELSMPLAEWKLGQLTVLAVTVSSPAGRDAGYSNQVFLHPIEPPARPKWSGLAAVPTGVALSWEPAMRAEDYAIERADGVEGQFVSLGRLGTEAFVDRTVQWGKTYRYRLRPYRRSQAGWIAGTPSAALELTPRDTFAPEVPAGLRAVRTPDSVELSWLKGADEDVDGYRVLRDGEDVSGLVQTASFSDGTAQPDSVHSYAVTAVDTRGNESEPSAALQVAPVRR